MNNLIVGISCFILLIFLVFTIIFGLLSPSGIIKIINKNKNIIFSVLFLIPICIFLYCQTMHFLIGWSSGSTDGWLGFLGAYFGALIAIGGIYWQVSVQNKEQTKSLEKQLFFERKNSFDSAIAVENYKQYISLANKIGKLIGELIYLKNHLHDTKKQSSDIERYNKFDVYFENAISSVIYNFDYINKFYAFKGNDEVVSNHENDFTELLVQIKDDRSIIEDMFVNINSIIEFENPEKVIEREISNLERLENIIIKTAIDLIK